MTRPFDPALPLLGALAAGFGLHAPAWAQASPPAAAASATDETAGATTLPVVRARAAAEPTSKTSLQTNQTSIGKGTQELRDIPQSVTVMTERLIDDAKLDTLRQALHYTAGITFAATENGTDQDIRMRGFPVATTGDLLIDGMKDPSQYDRDSFNYDRIEVMRGSASMLFGRGSTGGVINQVNKKPALYGANEIVTTIGTGGNVRLTGDIHQRLGENAALRINAMAQEADNHGAKISKYGFAPTLGWGLGTRDEFTVGLFHLNVDNVPMSNLRYLEGSVASQIPAKNFYGTASDYLTGTATYGTASWQHKFGDGSVLKTQVRSGTYDRATWGTTAGYCAVALTATGTCPTGTAAMTAAALSGSTALTRSGLAPRSDTITGSYLQTEYSRKFSALGLRHELLAGVDWSHEAADRSTAYGTVGTNYNKGGTTVGTPDDGRLTAALPTYRKSSDYAGTSIGAYAQDLIALTPEWKLLAGLRYDRVKATMNSYTFANTTTATTPSGTTTSELSYPGLWSRRFGVLWQPGPFQSFHLSYGTSFNTSADTYQYTTQQTASVGAEKSRNIELGAKLDWLDGALSTRAAIYRSEKYNERTTDSDFAGTFPVLSGKRHTEGVEFDVVGKVTPEVEVYLSYSHVFKAVIDKVGTAVIPAATTGYTSYIGAPVGLTPKNTGALWASWQFAPKWRIAGGVRGASENHPLIGGTAAASKTARAPGYVAYDAMLEYTVSQDMYLQFNAVNLTDKVYGDQLYPGFYTPGEGRSLKATVGVKF